MSYLNLTDDPGSLTPLEEAEEIIMAEYARILCSQSNNENQCLANINKEQLYLSIHGSHAVIRPVSVYSDPNTYLYQITCTDNPNPEAVILQRPNAFNRGNIIDDVYGPTRFRYNPDTGEYTEINTKVDPCAPKNLARTPGQELSRDNIIHERIGHSFLSAAGLGGNFTSSPMYQATDVLSDDMIIALFNEANIDPESIVEGGRQSQEIDREELLSDLIMLVATGVIEPPPGYGELMAQNIRQAIINRMSTEEYYELLYSKDVSIDELPTGNTSSRYRVIPRILTESAISETGQIVLNSPNYYNSLDESSQVTALGRSNEQVPDTSGFKEYWVYVEFNSKQRGWIRADLITGIDVEHLPEITPSTVDPFRQFDIDDPYNPSFEAALGSSN